MKKDTIIIGAGITGLTAAFYLKRQRRDFMVLEEKEQPGGVISTLRENGFLFETGPNTGVLGQPEAAALFEDLGNHATLEIAGKQVSKRYILKNGSWHALPSGFKDAVKTPLFTLKDKFRILAEPFRKRGDHPEETLEQMVIRRLGRSYLDYAVDPFILGVYAGDPEKLIPRYALPKLYRLEQQYGSFIRGAIKKKFETKSDFEKKATREIFSAKGGLQSIVNALYDQAGKENFQFHSKDIRVEKIKNEFRVLSTCPSGPCVIETKHVIITTGAHSLPALLPGIDAEAMQFLTNLRYAPVIEVAIGFRHWRGMRLDGFGALIPFREKRDLLGILFPSAFLEGRAPEGGALFTVFMGGVRRPELMEMDDEQVFQVVRKEFTSLMGSPVFEPDLFRIFRYPRAIPQYERSSGIRFKIIEQIENDYQGLMLRGNFRGGIGLADRIRQGRLSAEEIMKGSTT